MILALLGGLLAVAGAPACQVPDAARTQQLALPYDAFDSLPGPTGWRQLNAAGCIRDAVGLLTDYLAANRNRLTSEQRSEMQFHIGQTLAFAGLETESLPYFDRAADPSGDMEWRLYVAATVAFLRRDHASLVKAHDAYAADHPGSMRLKIIEGFIACANQTYAKAVHCAM